MPVALPFRTRHRLTHEREFQAVFAARNSRTRGPLVVFAAPSTLPHARLGLSVGRRVGSAVVRNRVKRLLREVFRLNLPALPAGLDLVVNVRPHRALPFAQYQRHLLDAVAQLTPRPPAVPPTAPQPPRD